MKAVDSIRYTFRSLLGVCIVLFILPLGYGPSSQVPLVTVTDLGFKVLGSDPTVRFGTFGYCVSIDPPNNGTSTTCFDPEFGYDVTALEFKTPESTIYFGADTRIEAIRSWTAQSMSNSVGVLHPVTLTLDVVALVVAFRSASHVLVCVVTLLSVCITIGTASVDLIWAFSLKNYYWALQGGESATHRGSGTIGPAVYGIVVALVLQLVALALTIVNCCLYRNERRCGRRKQRFVIDDDLNWEKEYKGWEAAFDSAQSEQIASRFHRTY